MLIVPSFISSYREPFTEFCITSLAAVIVPENPEPEGDLITVSAALRHIQELGRLHLPLCTPAEP